MVLRTGNPFNQFNPQFSTSNSQPPPESSGDFGAYGIRTRDLLNAIEALYQLS
jgi:hypothetical protein